MGRLSSLRPANQRPRRRSRAAPERHVSNVTARSRKANSGSAAARPPGFDVVGIAFSSCPQSAGDWSGREDAISASPWCLQRPRPPGFRGAVQIQKGELRRRALARLARFGARAYGWASTDARANTLCSTRPLEAFDTPGPSWPCRSCSSGPWPGCKRWTKRPGPRLKALHP